MVGDKMSNNMENVYDFSDEAVEDYKKRNRVMMFMMPAIMILFSIIMFKSKGTEDMMLFYMIIGGISAFVMLEIYILSRIMTKKMKNTRLNIFENHFVRVGGKKSDQIAFDDIISIKEKRNPKGKLLMIEMKTSIKPINIFGFENIETILEILLERSNSNINHKVKQYKIDWNNSGVLALIMITTVLLIGGLLNFNEDLYHLFNSVFMIAFGLFFILYKPASKSMGDRFRMFEIICGGLIIFSSLISMFARYIIIDNKFV